MQHIINSAQTCLDCKKPKCQTGCPVKTPIADMIRLLLEWNIKEASELFCEELETLPKPSSLEKLLELEDIEKDAMPQLIDVKVEKLKRVNVIMRSDILESLKERLVEFNGNRSAYLQNLVIKDLKSHKISIC